MRLASPPGAKHFSAEGKIPHSAKRKSAEASPDGWHTCTLSPRVAHVAAETRGETSNKSNVANGETTGQQFVRGGCEGRINTKHSSGGAELWVLPLRLVSLCIVRDLQSAKLFGIYECYEDAMQMQRPRFSA